MTKKSLVTRIVLAVIGITVLIGIAAIIFMNPNNKKETVSENIEQQEDITTQKSDTSSEEQTTDKQEKYILKESDCRFIDYSEIVGFDTEKLNLAKNEIYARHGYIFDTDKIANYFESCSWYSPSVKASEFTDSIFNQYEIQNIKLLGDYEKASEYTYPLEVKAGKSVLVDIDGDGKLEKVSLKKEKSVQKDSSADINLTISVDNSVLKYRDTDSEFSKLFVVDIDVNDKSKEICYQTLEPNDYIGSIYWQYTASHQLDRITFEGNDYYDESIEENSEYKFLPTSWSVGGAEYLGDGRVIFTGGCIAITQLNVDFEYRLTENGTFQYVERDYKAGEDYVDFRTGNNSVEITLKKDLVMYEERSKSSKKITVKPQKLKIIAVHEDTDNKSDDNFEYWAEIELEDKSTGWVPPLEMDIQKIEETFDGLHFWG